jgi:hypothetical protein
VRDHPGGIVECGEHRSQDAQRRLLTALLADLAANGAFEPGQSEAVGAGQVAAVAVHDDSHR